MYKTNKIKELYFGVVISDWKISD